VVVAVVPQDLHTQQQLQAQVDLVVAVQELITMLMQAQELLILVLVAVQAVTMAQQRLMASLVMAAQAWL
jgi:hypothetical protein